MTFTHALATNNYGPAKLIVATSAANGTHTTLASAMAAAVSGDTIFLRDSVTENIILTPGVNIASWGSGSSLNGSGKAAIIGTLTMTAAGSITISGIELQTNSAALLAVTGSAASVVNLENCYLNCTNNTGITYSSSSSSSAININNCSGNLGTTGIAYHTMSSAGSINYTGCQLFNLGGSTTITNNSAGLSHYYHCDISCPIGTTSTGGIGILYCNVDTALENTIALTHNGSLANSVARHSAFSSGTASAVTVGAGATLAYIQCNAGSTNTDAITGAGTISMIVPTFSGTSSLVNTTTQLSGIIQGRIDGNAPSAGIIGEQIRGYNTAVSLGVTPVAITSIALTPGVWDVACVAEGIFTGSVAGFTFGISTANNSFTLTQFDAYVDIFINATGARFSGSIPQFRVTLSANTTYYLVANAGISSGTATGYGRISATRVG